MLEATPSRRATSLDRPGWQGRVAVVSPHLDDAALSLGASIRDATRRGVRVDVITVLAGDPASSTPADEHNRRAGFATAGEAARLRREEDREACRQIGAQPIWLPLSDDGNEEREPDAVRHALRDALAGYDAVLLPGFPLAHPDHRLVTGAALEVLPQGQAIGLYVEQPYASWEALGRRRPRRPGASGALEAAVAAVGLQLGEGQHWRRHRGRPGDWVAKTRSMTAHASQLAVLRRLPRTRILAYEALVGGERVLWLALD